MSFVTSNAEPVPFRYVIPGYLRVRQGLPMALHAADFWWHYAETAVFNLLIAVAIGTDLVSIRRTWSEFRYVVISMATLAIPAGGQFIKLMRIMAG